MRRKVFICSILLVVALVCVLCFPVKSELYSVEIIDDQYYLRFPNDYDASKEMYVPYFSSIAEMRNKILSGQLSEKEVAYLQYYHHKYGDEAGNLMPICNLDKLYDICLPSDMRLESIEWTGLHYCFVADGDNSSTLFLQICPEDEYNAVIESYSTLTPNQTVTLVENEPERNATVTHYYTGVGKFKYVDFQITRGETNLTIQEKFVLDHWDKDDISHENPKTIRCAGKEDETFFYAVMFDRQHYERPSLEWYGALGLKEYHDTTWIVYTVICLCVAAVVVVFYVYRKKKMPVQIDTGATADIADP